MSDVMPASFEWDVRANTNVFHTVVSGSDGIKKLDKIRSKYRIPDNEKIMAYSKSSGIGILRLGLSLSGIIITDQAFYVHPSKESGSAENRIPFSELCKYLPVQVSEKAPVYLIGKDREIDILGGTIIAKNPVGQEVKAFLLEMEKHLIRTYDWAAEQRKDTITWALDNARDVLSRSRLDDKTRGILDAINADEIVCNEVAKIVAADLYRSGNFDEYQSYVRELPSYISDDEKTALLDADGLFNQYLADLGDANHDFDRALLEEFCKNMEEKEYTDKRFVAYVYAAVRLYDAEKLDVLFGAVQKAFPSYYTNLRLFHGKYSNHRMESVYCSVRDGKKLDRESLGWSDSLGFTALSYAIMLRKTDQLDTILKKGHWKEIYPDGLSEEAAGLFNYTVLAVLCDYTGSEVSTILQNTSEILRSMNRHLKVLKAKRFLSSQLVSSQKNMIRAMQARARNGDIDYDELEDRLSQAQSSLQKNQAYLRQFDKEIAEVEDEIKAYITDTITQSYSVAHALRNSTNPLVQLYLRLIDSPTVLFTVLKESQSHPQLFCWNAFYFVAHEELTKDVYGWREGAVYYIGRKAAGQMPPTDDEPNPSSQESAASQVERPYGSSWFSPKAHSDQDALRKEYRQLAKEYHPDVNKLTDTTKIFQEILNEKIEILENMK